MSDIAAVYNFTVPARRITLATKRQNGADVERKPRAPFNFNPNNDK